MSNIKKEVRYIDLEFTQFKLPLFDILRDEINECANNKKIIRTIPILVRTLIENLMHRIFSASLAGEYKKLYYDTKNDRIMNLSGFLNLFNKLKKKFKEFYIFTAPKDLIKHLQEIRVEGNNNVHFLVKYIKSNYVLKTRERNSNVVLFLLNLYDLIIKSRKKIDKIDPELLKKEKKFKKKKNIQLENQPKEGLSIELCDKISEIRTLLSKNLNSGEIKTKILINLDHFIIKSKMLGLTDIQIDNIQEAKRLFVSSLSIPTHNRELLSQLISKITDNIL